MQPPGCLASTPRGRSLGTPNAAPHTIMSVPLPVVGFRGLGASGLAARLDRGRPLPAQGLPLRRLIHRLTLFSSHPPDDRRRRYPQIGQPAARAPVVGTTLPRCGHSTGKAPPGQRLAVPPGACSTSVGMPAGLWAKSRAPTSTTWSGSTGRRSGAPTGTRSTSYCGGPVAAERRAFSSQTDEACSEGGSARRGPRGASIRVREVSRAHVAPWARLAIVAMDSAPGLTRPVCVPATLLGGNAVVAG